MTRLDSYSFGALSNLRQRLDMSIKAALQAQRDFDDARRRAGLAPQPPVFTVDLPDDPPEPARQHALDAPSEIADPAAVARQIIEAGRRRRAEAINELPPEGSLARQIIDAGKRRRGEKI